MRNLDWGLIDYETALQKQLELVEQVSVGSAQDTLIFCSHPAVVTLGRATKPEDISTWQGPIVEISRGGRATYHGPSQVVVYPIIDLVKNSIGKDLNKYLRLLEKAILESLQEFGVQAQTNEGETGVWIGSHKIASIGVAVKKWVTYHGIAVNVLHDPKAFYGINPCGYSPETMISLQEILGVKPDVEKYKKVLQQKLNLLISENIGLGLSSSAGQSV